MTVTVTLAGGVRLKFVALGFCGTNLSKYC
jgi:hypothetical protein